MARIEGVDIPRNKRVVISLTYIFGVGLPTSKAILDRVNIDHSKRVKDLTESEVQAIHPYHTETGWKTDGQSVPFANHLF